MSNVAQLKLTKMPEKVKPTAQEIIVNKFAFHLLKHWKKVKIQDCVIKIHVESLCDQDLYFLTNLITSTNGDISVSICRSGKGVSIFIGCLQLKEVPDHLKKYSREDLMDLYKPAWVLSPNQ